MTLISTLFVVLSAAAGAFLLIYYVSTWAARELAPAEAQAELKAAARAGSRRFWVKLVGRAQGLVPGKLATDLNRQIVQAGGLEGMSPAEVVAYATIATLLALCGGVLVVALTGWSPWIVLGIAVVGALMPFIWLRDQVKRRHQDILHDLAFHLDLLTLSVEAGLDFGAAVGRMVDKGRPGPLREEFASFLGEIRIGKTRAEAMQAMSDRVGLVALTNFLGALIQADRLGTGIGKTLRLQSEQLRNERFNRAEKAASEAPVKMLLPLVIFIFPTIWIILAAPLVFEWMYRGAP